MEFSQRRSFIYFAFTACLHTSCYSRYGASNGGGIQKTELDSE